MHRWVRFMTVIGLFIGWMGCHKHAVTYEEELSKQARIEGRFEQEYELTKNPITGEVPRQNLWKISKDIAQKNAQKSIDRIQWSECGPNNVGGRTRALLIDAQDPTFKTVWAGGISGGLWKTTDVTATEPLWTKVNDFMDNLSITTIAQDLSNSTNMYFGTGEGWQGNDVIRGLGIFKSIDGGASWQQLPATNNPNFYYIQKIIVDANGHVFAATRSGLYTSVDEGISWTQVLGITVGLGDSDLAADIELATNGDLFATLGIFSKGSVWKSSSANHGANTGTVGTWTNISPSGNYRRTEIATAPSNPNMVYAICQSNTSGNVAFFYQSTNGGSSWISKSIASWGNQTWYNLILAIDPNNPNRIHAGGTPTFISNDGGNNWLLSYFGVHVDFHDIQFINSSSSEIICSNDGGIYHTTNGQSDTPTFQAKNNGYNVTQFYSCAVHPDDADNLFLAGSQDNGTQKVIGEGIQPGTLVTSGDGGFCHIDESNPDIMFTSFLRNNINRSIDGGLTFQTIIQENTGSFINPSDYDNDAHILYAGSNTGHFLRWNDPQTGNAYDEVEVSFFLDKRVTHVLVSPNVPNRIYFGLSNGSVVFVNDANTNLSFTGNLIKTGIGSTAGASVSGISIEKGNEDHILVSYSNYGVESIWESQNASGASPTWENIEGDLPDMPVRWCHLSPHNAAQAVIATELGVWSTEQINGANTMWTPSNDGLANVRVDMLQFRKNDSLLVAATHGRGLFSTNFFSKQKISFQHELTEIEENNVTNYQNTCQGYAELAIPVEIAKNTFTDLEVSIQIKNESTALSNRDFILETTNLTFVDGGPLEQDVIVKIFDDAYAELDETIILEISVTGETSILDISEHTITILDDDIEPMTGKTTEVHTFGTGVSNFSFAPFRGISEDEKAEFILLNTELTQKELINGNIKSIAFHVNSKNSAFPYENFTIGVKNSLDTAADYEFESSTTLVFNENLETQLGWNTLNFDVPFLWDGTSNLIFQTCYDNSQSSSNDVVTASAPGFNASEFDFKNNEVGCNLTTPAGAFPLRPNLELTIEQPTKISNTVAASDSYWIGAGETAHFYDQNGQIIASIQQLSGLDMGCVSVSIDNYGTGQFTLDWLNGMASDKTFMVEIDNPQPYELTLYFSEAELAVWGSEKMNLNMLTNSETIKNSLSENAEIFSQSQLTKANYGTASNIFYRGTFNADGGFAVTNAEPITVLPLELVDFFGETTLKGHLLNWETDFEQNTDFFLVEKSTNGIDFQTLAVVNASGFSNTSVSYTHLNEQPFLGKNYYRLKVIDMDGSENVYQTIILESDQISTNSFLVYPSLITEKQFNLTFKTPQSSQGTLSIFNSVGNLIYNELLELEPGNNHFTFDKLPLITGNYVILLEINGQFYSQQVWALGN